MGAKIRTYYRLTKPGIIYGNAITAVAGFLLGAKGKVDVLLLIQTLFAISLVIASACVYNNYIDRDIDSKMARTKNRAMVTKSISEISALIFGTILGGIGFLLLICYTNIITTTLGLIAFIDYVVLYGITKRASLYGTIVGSISGALPPVAGYTAATNNFDMAALILFLIMVLWQMPHFYAIAIFRVKDYMLAGIPVLPAATSVQTTKNHIFFYISAFLISTTLLTFFRYTGYIYLFVMLACGLYWLFLGWKGFSTTDDTKWAKGVFRFSLILILVFSLLLYFNVVLP